MLTIGLTGKTGAGKSTVALLLKEKGCCIIDGDVIARQITEKGSPVLLQLQKAFGEDILDENGELIRKTLDEYKEKRSNIENGYSGDYEVLTVDEGGYFFRNTDGYEEIYSSKSAL